MDSTIKGTPLADEGLTVLTLGGFLREVCGRYADREALVFHPATGPVVRLTYAQVWQEAFAVARALVARGVTKETRVGLLATNRPEWVTAMFGIALAGGTCVALSTFAKGAELKDQLRMGDISLLIFERSVLDRDFAAELIELCPDIAQARGEVQSTELPFLRRIVCIGEAAPSGAFELWSSFLRGGPEGDRTAPAGLVDAIAGEVAPTDRGMVFFSSGSTAKPKAIVHAHRAGALQCWRWRDVFALDSDVRTWTANGFFWSGNFCMAVGATFAAGGCLVLQRTFTPGESLRLMQVERVSLPLAWPHQWAQLAAESTYREVDLGSLRYVGEASPLRAHPTVKSTWQEPVSSYGNTETFTMSTVYPSGTPASVAAGNHGVPLPGNTVRVVDPESGRLLQRGETGEIAVKGPTLMLGYLRVPREDTFDDQGFFRTGDCGFVDDDGRLHWHGRLSDIIKTGGANVSPLEIDAVIAECPGVKIVATVGIPHSTLGEMVVACVVPEAGVRVDEGQVRAFVSKRLSSYKVPRRVLLVEESELTLTGSNKVKTAPLRELAARRVAARTSNAGANMTCEPTKTPDDVDIPALRERYRRERERRLRPEGQEQYLRTADDFVDQYETDPHTAVKPREPISEDLDIAILGAGWSGLLAGYHLKQAGVTAFRNIDLAGDVGGCWYWNRFPGLQCDNDAYCYIPLLEATGTMPSKKYADGFEIFEHAQRVASRFGLYEKALFHTLVRTMRWNEETKRWHLRTNRGDDLRARFVIMACGPLNRPKLPGIPGIKSFKGHTFHTARWDYDFTGGTPRNPTLDKLADKRVVLVGTGATAIQVVPHLGRDAKQLYVVQRTPSSVYERFNQPTDPQWVKGLRSGWQKERQANFHAGAMRGFASSEQDAICDFWTALNRNIRARLAEHGTRRLAPAEYAELREREDFRLTERMRRRVESLVQHKATAEALKPYYGFGCKRPCSSDNYLETFNRPNVELLDVSGTRGLERMTDRGIVAGGVEYPVDCVIFASGFEISSELSRRWGIDVIVGRNGVSIYDQWRDGYKTLHGMMTHGFPNQFFIHFSQGGLNANITVTFDQQAHHIAHIIKESLRRGAKAVECSQEAQDAWVQHLRATAIDMTPLQRECTPGYYFNEGEEKFRYFLGEPYGPGYDAFDALIREWRDQGDMAGLVLET